MKKTRSLLAVLACLALLVSLCVSASAAGTKTVSNTADFTKLEVGTTNEGIAAATGVTFPEIVRESGVPNNWYIAELGSITMEDGTVIPNPPAMTPSDGYAENCYIQTLELPEGKVLTADATLDIGYMLAAGMGWIVASVSTDGENWTEVAADEEGIGNDWDVTFSNYREFKGESSIPLPGTAGASVVYVKIAVERHSGQYSGNVHYTTINGTIEADAEDSDETGDMIGVVVALLAVSGVGITVLKKKEN